jgi:2-desacetyl-2-hydroxyethyl bacteriochlorophyllide A dehydrogenase
MNTFTIVAPEKYLFRDSEVPFRGRDEVLMRMIRMGLCGSDLNTWRGLNPLVSYPRSVGHEICGIIEETGGEVPDNIIPGKHATVVPYTNCGKCLPCTKGRTNACEFNQTMGVQREGASSEYIVVPWKKLILSEKLSVDQLVLVEPMSVGFHAVSRGEVYPGDAVAVIGCGMIGLGAIVGSAAITGRTFAIDIAQNKLDLAKMMGARVVINSNNEDVHTKLMELTDGKGPDVIIEAVGLPATFRQAIDLAGFTGKVVYIGYAAEEVAYETKLFVMKELDIRGSRNALQEDFIAVVKILERGQLPVNKIITRKFPFLEMGNAFKYWVENRSDVTKIIIDYE